MSDQMVRPVRRSGHRPALDRAAVRYFIYMLSDESGTALYIGRSCNVASRLRAHHSELTREYSNLPARPTWLLDARSVALLGPFIWSDACRVEREQIETHQPRGNRMFTRAHGWHGSMKLSEVQA